MGVGSFLKGKPGGVMERIGFEVYTGEDVHSTVSNMVTEHHNNANRIFLISVSKCPLGEGLASMDISSAALLALQNLQIPEHKLQGIDSWYPLINRGGHEGNKEHSAQATATVTPHASKVSHPGQLLPEQRHVHLVEVKRCGETRPKNQLQEAAPRTLLPFSKNLSSSHSAKCGRGSSTPLTLWSPLKSLLSQCFHSAAPVGGYSDVTLPYFKT
eukprot:1139621-Pelagomonas_calceolata.AAC.3